jgi:hypothetical protein
VTALLAKSRIALQIPGGELVAWLHPVFRGSSSILGKTRVGGLTAPRSSRKSNKAVQTRELCLYKNSLNSNLDWSLESKGERTDIQLFKITVRWAIPESVAPASSDHEA